MAVRRSDSRQRTRYAAEARPDEMVIACWKSSFCAATSLNSNSNAFLLICLEIYLKGWHCQGTRDTRFKLQYAYVRAKTSWQHDEAKKDRKLIYCSNSENAVDFRVHVTARFGWNLRRPALVDFARICRAYCTFDLQYVVCLLSMMIVTNTERFL